ncbi:NUDIX hydrolase domain-like protein [Immersiella caudata]|uniref:NUDIX hydrolase domain-like protein n=1 Tax=Immersiella caudata TaxID=314043 RepID=A0AA40CCA0_9PEZI|nr:NUDIX hydrolase domain-like protein [Immersiella caudata]
MSGSVEADTPQQAVDTQPVNQDDIQTVAQTIRDLTSTEVQVVHPGGENGGDDFGITCYWDASSMAPLNARSAAAVARLRAYKPPPAPLWGRLHLSRRAAVLLLLFADRRGDLRVVVTMRAASLRSFSGHAALPGGKADTIEETPFQIARREAWEEIGLPMEDAKLPSPFRIEHLCDLPMNLARTELIVRPCVAFLHANEPSVPTGAPRSPSTKTPTVEESMIPRLDAKEVAAVFSAPFSNFLKATDEELPAEEARRRPLPPGKWYEGNWLQFNGQPWRAHYFYVPVNDQRVMKPKRQLSAAEEEVADELGEKERYQVWGMTARILVDAARIAYGQDPEFEHNSHYGDEGMIEDAEKQGRLGPKKKTSEAPKV